MDVCEDEGQIHSYLIRTPISLDAPLIPYFPGTVELFGKTFHLFGFLTFMAVLIGILRFQRLMRFTPVGISGVLFSDSVGAQLSVDNFGAQGDGQSLAVQQDDDASELEIDLGFTSDFISLDFGNDDPGNTNPGDIAVLTAFLGAVQVGQETLLLNRDGLMNQTIMFGVIGGATLFDIATFAFTDSTFDLITGGFPFNTDFGSTEIVDNISINALQVQVQVQVPEPATILLIGLGVLGLNRKFR